jgi:probable HAF family extracellular repeat protein
MRTITFLALCSAASPLLSCTESTAPTAPISSIRPAATKTPTITITDLGAFWPAAIGPRGQVVGWTEATPNRAVLWENGVLHDLGTLPGGDHARAFGINAAGQIVGMGNSSATGYIDHAILWDHGVPRDLGTLPGGPSSSASAISPSGRVIVGSSESTPPGADMVHHAVTWKDGVITDLGELGILTITDAGAISPSGVVVGNAGGGPMVHAFRWEKGVMTELSALPPGSWDQRRAAAAINSQGQIVGYSEVFPVNEMNYHAVRWDKDGITDLGTLPGGTESFAAGINEPGQIVGQTLTADGQFVAVLWDHGRVTNLGTLSGGLGSAANAINNQGQIVGFSSIQGVVHAVLWTVK